MSEPAAPAQGASRNRPRITRIGIHACSAAATFTLAGMILIDSTLLFLGLCLIILVGLARFVAALNTKGVVLSHLLPDSTHAGETFRVQMVLSNSSRFFDRVGLTIQDSAVSSHRYKPLMIDILPAGRTMSMNASSRLMDRGIFSGFQYRVSSLFPFGFFESARECTVLSRIIVFPNPSFPSHVTRILEQGAYADGNRNIVSGSCSGDFRSLREYRPGDHVKLISWPASTRRTFPVVRELDQPIMQEARILFHSYEPPRTVLSRPSFESAYRTLAGLFHHLHRNQVPFTFAAAFTGWRDIAVSDQQDLARALEHLAGAGCHASHDIEELIVALNRESRQPSSHIIVSNCPQSYWLPMLPSSPLPAYIIDNDQATMTSPQAGVLR